MDKASFYLLVCNFNTGSKYVNLQGQGGKNILQYIEQLPNYTKYILQFEYPSQQVSNMHNEQDTILQAYSHLFEINFLSKIILHYFCSKIGIEFTDNHTKPCNAALEIQLQNDKLRVIVKRTSIFF